MAQLVAVLFLLTFLQVCFAPPVSKNKEEQVAEEADVLQDYMEYHRYLRQVVTALESDPDFRSKLEKADEADIKSGKIADQLHFVDHNVRTRLDELKRTELQRLKDLTLQNQMMGNYVDDPMHHHLDNTNPHTFEVEDLKKLIAKTTEDLAEADKKRRDEFKEYELQKEFEKQEKLNHTVGEDRIKLEKEYVKLDRKHKQHDKLHEPGHKAQLEEVWEEQDHMQQDFDPKAFFMLHDLDGNRMWDQDEVKALFIKELDKMYQAGAPEDDMRERMEEMERMRESVFGEMDLNRDGFIDFNEFLAQTQRKDFQQDDGWQGLDEKKSYTNEELEEYISRHHANVGYPNQYPPGAHPNDAYYNEHGAPIQLPPPNYQQQVPPQGNPQFPNQHPGNVPNLNTNEVYNNQPNVQYVQQNQNNQQYPQGNQQPVPNQQQQQGQQYQQPQAVPNQQGQQQQQYQQPQAVPNQQGQLPHQTIQNQQGQPNIQQQQQQAVPNQLPHQAIPNQQGQQAVPNQQGQPVVQKQPVPNAQNQQNLNKPNNVPVANQV